MLVKKKFLALKALGHVYTFNLFSVVKYIGAVKYDANTSHICNYTAHRVKVCIAA